MRRVFKSACVAITLIALTSGISSADAAVCVSADDARGLGSRVLQSRLMVAALSCNNRTQYNAVVTQYKSSFQKDGNVLRRFFSRYYGKAGKKELNRFATQMANTASQHSTRNQRAFCKESQKVFQVLLNGDISTYAKIRQQFYAPQFHGFQQCRAKVE